MGWSGMLKQYRGFSNMCSCFLVPVLVWNLQANICKWSNVNQVAKNTSVLRNTDSLLLRESRSKYRSKRDRERPLWYPVQRPTPGKILSTSGGVKILPPVPAPQPNASGMNTWDARRDTLGLQKAEKICTVQRKPPFTWRWNPLPESILQSIFLVIWIIIWTQPPLLLQEILRRAIEMVGLW